MSKKVNLIGFLPLIPLLIVAGVVPLVVYLKVIPVPAAYRSFWPAEYVFDFFSYYKARIVLVCAGLLLLVGIWLTFRWNLPDKWNNIYIPLTLFVVALIASTVKSRYPWIAWNGYFDRDEGFWVLLAYIILFLGAYLFISKARQVWMVLAAWGLALTIICIIGFFQYFGMDPFQTMAGRLLILPAEYHYLAEGLDFLFSRYTIYATLYNPNYVAAMMSLAFPVAAAFFIFSARLRERLIFGILSSLLLLTMIGSNGRAALVAALLVMTLLILVTFRDGLLGGWKRFLLLLFVGLAGFGLLNFASGGRLAKHTDESSADVRSVVQENAQGNSKNERSVVPGNVVPAKSEGLAEQLIRKYGPVASGRGYIWIRSVQMASHTLLLGRGPDTFGLYFPNADPYKAYYTLPDYFIDKPHNSYLQVWFNLGGLGLLAFLAMVGMHFFSTLKLLRKAPLQKPITIMALALFLGWVSYLLVAFFYDSALSVAPLFWIIFGLGLAVNRMAVLPENKAMTGARSR